MNTLQHFTLIKTIYQHKNTQCQQHLFLQISGPNNAKFNDHSTRAKKKNQPKRLKNKYSFVTTLKKQNNKMQVKHMRVIVLLHVTVLLHLLLCM